MTPVKDHKTLCPQGNGPGDYFFENNFQLDCDDDFLITSIRLYKYFLANGKDGLDAKQLYDHLLFTSKVQSSKKVKANQTYIKNGLGWGTAKVKKAKAFLHAAGLIEYHQPKGDMGLFDGQTIVLKSTWNEESFLRWIEKKTGGSKTDPPENCTNVTGGSEIEPAEDMGVSETEDTKYPVGHLSVQRLTEPPVSSNNYKGSYKKRILPQEENPPSESSPPAVGISSLTQMKSHLIEMVKKRDPETRFHFTPAESEQIAIAYTRFGSEWLIEVFHDYLTRKTVSQVNKFHSSDIPQFIKRAIEKDKNQKPQKTTREPKYHHCPVCDKTWSATSTLSMCPKCGLDLRDFDNYQEIESHRSWWQEMSNRRNQAAG